MTGPFLFFIFARSSATILRNRRWMFERGDAPQPAGVGRWTGAPPQTPLGEGSREPCPRPHPRRGSAPGPHGFFSIAENSPLGSNTRRCGGVGVWTGRSSPGPALEHPLGQAKAERWNPPGG